MVKITVGWGGELQGSETDIVKSLVINAHNLVCIFDKLMDWQGSIVGLNDGIGDLRWWHNGECAHDSVWILLSDFWDKESSHTRTGTTTEGVGDLKALQAVATFSFLSNDIEDWVDQLGTFGVVALSPVVTGSTLTENKVVWSEKLTEWSGSYWVHGSWLQVHQDGSGDISSTSGFVVVNVDSFQLEIRVTVISTGGIDSVLVRDDLPELGTDLVSALSALDVYDFSHF